MAELGTSRQQPGWTASGCKRLRQHTDTRRMWPWSQDTYSELQLQRMLLFMQVWPGCKLVFGRSLCFDLVMARATASCSGHAGRIYGWMTPIGMKSMDKDVVINLNAQSMAFLAALRALHSRTCLVVW